MKSGNLSAKIYQSHSSADQPHKTAFVREKGEFVHRPRQPVALRVANRLLFPVRPLDGDAAHHAVALVSGSFARFGELGIGFESHFDRMVQNLLANPVKLDEI